MRVGILATETAGSLLRTSPRARLTTALPHLREDPCKERGDGVIGAVIRETPRRAFGVFSRHNNRRVRMLLIFPGVR